MYRLEFKNWNEQTVTVVIGCTEDNEEGLRLEADPVVLTEDNDDDPFLPVRCWSGYINIANCTPEMAMMLTSEPWPVEVWTGSVLTFAGQVRCESFTSGLFERPMSLQLPVECPLSKLKRMDMKAKLEETSLLDLARECVLEAVPDATVNVEPLNDGYLPSAYRLNKAIFCTWSEADLRLDTSKKLYDVLSACLLPIGYVARISGKTVTMKRYGHAQAARLESVSGSFYGTNHTFSIKRPANKVVVRATGCELDEPGFTLADAKMGIGYGTTFTVGDYWYVTVSYGNLQKMHNMETFVQNGRVGINPVILYRNDKNGWTGGGVLMEERVRGEFERGGGQESGRYLVITRSFAEKKGGTSVMTTALAHFRTTVPLTYDSGMYLKGKVTGMTESNVNGYKWGNNCAGTIICEIKYLNKWWTMDAKTGSYGWSDTQGKCYVSVGDGDQPADKNNMVGWLGLSENGYHVRSQLLPDVSGVTNVEDMLIDVKVYGFSPLNDDTLFCRIEDLEIEVESQAGNYKSHEHKLRDDGEDVYARDLDAVSNMMNSMWGLGLGLQSVPLFELAKSRMGYPRLVLELEMRGGPFTPSINWMYAGRELTVMASELHLRDNVRKVKLLEAGLGTGAALSAEDAARTGAALTAVETAGTGAE